MFGIFYDRFVKFFCASRARILFLCACVLFIVALALVSYETFREYSLPIASEGGRDVTELVRGNVEDVAPAAPAASAASETGVVFVLRRGLSLREISRELQRIGAIRYGYFFEIIARIFGMGHSLQAGEYRFSARTSLYEVLRLLRDGRTHYYSLTIPEGLTSLQILDILRSSERLTGDLPSALTEGSLLADTYHYQRDTPRVRLVLRMESAMKTFLRDVLSKDRLHERSAASRRFLRTPQEVLTFASLVERETKLSVERDRIAGVFFNRLSKGMKLQTDPTLIYWESGKRGVLGRGLRRSELRRDHPYNTYTRTGLPPSPIANPGRAAIYSALRAEISDELYFVASGDGGHRFAKTFSEHLRNVELWRDVEKSRRVDRPLDEKSKSNGS